MKEVRKEYIQEMELQRIEKQIKDEKKKEALRIANEERKAAKAAAKKAKAAERQVAEEEFRQTLVCHTRIITFPFVSLKPLIAEHGMLNSFN